MYGSYQHQELDGIWWMDDAIVIALRSSLVARRY
jgi:hypothetical protein